MRLIYLVTINGVVHSAHRTRAGARLMRDAIATNAKRRRNHWRLRIRGLRLWT